MKRFFWLMNLFLALPLVVAEAAPDKVSWLTASSSGNRVERFYATGASKDAYKAGSKPFSLKPLPDQSGYALLYLGAKSFLGGVKEPGGIVYLSNDLQPIGKKLPFSGLVRHEFFREDLGAWFVFTAESSGFIEKNHTLTAICLQTGVKREISLESAPSLYQMIDPGRLAVLTSGDAQSSSPPQLILVNLNDWTTSAYSLSKNPGALFVIDSQRLLVACGGDKPGSGFSLNTGDAAATEEAILHLIDLAQQTITRIPAGYAPLAIVQDRQQSDKFYLTTSLRSHSIDPASLVQVLNGQAITASLELDVDPVFIAQAATGNLCVLGRQEFLLIDPQSNRVIRKTHYDMRPEELLFNDAETVAYLTNVNSNFMEVIDLHDGNTLARVQLGKSSLLRGFRLSKLLPASYPPVIGMPEKLEPLKEVPTNRRMIMDAGAGRLFVLVGTSEVAVVDLATNRVIRSLPLSGAAYGLHLTPNRAYLAVPTETHWHLLDPDRLEPVVLRMAITNDEDSRAPEAGYYSPDDQLLIVPFENTLFVVDAVQGRLLRKIRSRTPNPVILWP